MAAGDVPGLRLTGVRAGSPADKGGLKAGDVIVLFGGQRRDATSTRTATRSTRTSRATRSRSVYVRGGTPHHDDHAGGAHA